MRITAPGDVAESLEDATVSLGVVESVADRILGSRSFAVALAYVLSLPAHRYGVADRPESPLDWDRKAWSRLHSFSEYGVPVDPGNVVLACCTQALMCRAGATVGSKSARLCGKCGTQREALLAHFKLGEPCVDFVRLAWVYVQHHEERMQVEHRLTSAKLEAMGDVMEAVAGICHEWRRESRVIITERIMRELLN